MWRNRYPFVFAVDLSHRADSRHAWFLNDPSRWVRRNSSGAMRRVPLKKWVRFSLEPNPQRCCDFLHGKLGFDQQILNPMQPHETDLFAWSTPGQHSEPGIQPGARHPYRAEQLLHAQSVPGLLVNDPHRRGHVFVLKGKDIGRSPTMIGLGATSLATCFAGVLPDMIRSRIRAASTPIVKKSCGTLDTGTGAARRRRSCCPRQGSRSDWEP